MEKNIVIVGGGSSGFGAAYRALLHGNSHVILIEKNSSLGGSSTFGGVNCWEPGIGGNGIHFEIASRLEKSGLGFVGESFGNVTRQTPFCHSIKSKDSYKTTLVRANKKPDEQRRFHFDPVAMSNCMLDLLNEVNKDNKLTILFNSEVVDLEVEDGKIKILIVSTPNGIIKIEPSIVIDSTGDIVIARKAGCKFSVGEDSSLEYNEPHAPEVPEMKLNGLSMVFVVSPCEKDYVEIVPDEYKNKYLDEYNKSIENGMIPYACFNDYPNGDINVNMLPTLQGNEYIQLSKEELDIKCKTLVYAYWNFITSKKIFTGYRIKKIFPMVGIRESYRLVGKYVLNENDLFLGYAKILGENHSIAFADHPADLHGKTNKSGGMTTFEKYGIPYECLLPNEISNLIVSCRGASFSHIAASSARLSRTMIAIGEAAGITAAICLEENIKPISVDISKIRDIMKITEK